MSGRLKTFITVVAKTKWSRTPNRSGESLGNLTVKQLIDTLLSKFAGFTHKM